MLLVAGMSVGYQVASKKQAPRTWPADMRRKRWKVRTGTFGGLAIGRSPDLVSAVNTADGDVRRIPATLGQDVGMKVRFWP
jgi:hypothetical protein